MEAAENSSSVKVEIIIPCEKLGELEVFLAEHGGRINSVEPLEIQDTCSQLDEQSNVIAPTYDVLDTAQTSGKVLHLLQVYKIPIAQFGLHVLERSQGRTSELLNRPKPFERLSEDGRKVYRKMKKWLEQEDPIGELRGKMQGKRKRGQSRSTIVRTKFSILQRIALEALYKDTKYPTQGVIEEFANSHNLDSRTVRIWFNNKRQRGHNSENVVTSVELNDSVTELS